MACAARAARAMAEPLAPGSRRQSDPGRPGQADRRGGHCAADEERPRERRLVEVLVPGRERQRIGSPAGARGPGRALSRTEPSAPAAKGRRIAAAASASRTARRSSNRNEGWKRGMSWSGARTRGGRRDRGGHPRRQRRRASPASPCPRHSPGQGHDASKDARSGAARSESRVAVGHEGVHLDHVPAGERHRRRSPGRAGSRVTVR